FDRVRRGEVPVGRDLVNVSLSAKDYIRGLIEEPEATAPIIGEAILAELEQLLGTAATAAADGVPAASAPPAVAAAAVQPAGDGWRIGIAFAPDVLRNGTNPL
ncbi:chemotaxis protein CheA, partial [Methylobacterium sp. 22177]